MDLDPREEYPSLVVWISDDNQFKREHHEQAKYALQVCIDDEDFSSGLGFVLNTESEPTLVKHVTELIKIYNVAGGPGLRMHRELLEKSQGKLE